MSCPLPARFRVPTTRPSPGAHRCPRPAPATALLTALLTALAAVAATGCVQDPVTGDVSTVSEEREIEWGDRTAPLVEERFGGLYHDPALEAYVREVGASLTAHGVRTHLPWKFAVLNTSTVNALSLPGGRIYVTRGLLARISSEAELAFILSHEIAHVELRHAAAAIDRRVPVNVVLAPARLAAALTGTRELVEPNLRAVTALSGVVLDLVESGYSRAAEAEADREGARLALAAGHSPRGAVRLLRVLKAAETARPTLISAFYRSHPWASMRIQDMEAWYRTEHPGALTDPDLGMGEEAWAAAAGHLAEVQAAYDRFDQAVEALADMDMETAEREVRAALDMRDDQARFHVLLGQLLVLRARDLAGRAAARAEDAGTAPDADTAAEIERLQRESAALTTEARDALLRAVRLDPDAYEARLVLAEAHLRLGAVDAAEAAATEAVRRIPAHPLGWLFLGRVLEVGAARLERDAAPDDADALEEARRRRVRAARRYRVAAELDADGLHGRLARQRLRELNAVGISADEPLPEDRAPEGDGSNR